MGHLDFWYIRIVQNSMAKSILVYKNGPEFYGKEHFGI